MWEWVRILRRSEQKTGLSRHFSAPILPFSQHRWKQLSERSIVFLSCTVLVNADVDLNTDVCHMSAKRGPYRCSVQKSRKKKLFYTVFDTVKVQASMFCLSHVHKQQTWLLSFFSHGQSVASMYQTSPKQRPATGFRPTEPTRYFAKPRKEMEFPSRMVCARRDSVSLPDWKQDFWVVSKNRPLLKRGWSSPTTVQLCRLWQPSADHQYMQTRRHCRDDPICVAMN